MGHWHGEFEISSNVTFAYCTKGCIDVAVLRCRPLTHVRSLSMQNLNPFLALFLSERLFPHENSQRGCMRVRKLSHLKDRHTQSAMGGSIARKLTRLERRVLRHQLAQVCASSCIMTCFSCAAMVFRYSKRARTSFT